jgi:hypothetical protein
LRVRNRIDRRADDLKRNRIGRSAVVLESFGVELRNDVVAKGLAMGANSSKTARTFVVDIVAEISKGTITRDAGA